MAAHRYHEFSLLKNIEMDHKLSSLHYRIIEKLGEGGMGEVYLAEDMELNRKVAVKFLLKAETAEENSIKRLVREAQATAALDHPNICTIYEIGEDAGCKFIVMQYVEGETLAARLQRQSLSLNELLDVAVQVADAIEEAHSHGIIHRDLKPQNIMITPRGQVKVLDFGLAKMLHVGTTRSAGLSTTSLLTAPGTPVGTTQYMSPEQLRAEEIDCRSDIFSLGAIIFEMLVGKSLFKRDSPLATISAILTSEVPPLSQFRSDCPSQLQHVLRRCLEKEPEHRYKSARELSNDLKAIKTGGTISTVANTSETSGKRTIRRRLLVGLVAGLLLLSGALVLLPYPKNWFRLNFAADSGEDGQVSTQPVRAASIKTIAALPFVTDANAEAEFLSRGFTQSLINNLSRLPEMRVSSYSAVARYEKQSLDPTSIGRELDVEALLTGHFMLRGTSLIINVELIDARTKGHLWGHSYTRPLSNILEIQREICQDINDTLRSELGGEQRRRIADQHTDNPEAYRQYLMGRNAWGRRTPEDVKKSIEHFNEAIKLDPTYALAYVGLSDAYTTLGVTLPVFPPADVMPQAKAAAEEALQKDDQLAEAHTALAVIKMTYEWDWEGAEREFKRAIQLNPNSASAHNWYAYYLIAMARFPEAQAEAERARQLDPLSLFFNSNKARTFFYAQEYDKVIENSLKILSTNPKFHNSYFMLGLAYAQKGDYKQAIESFQTVRSLAGENPLWNAMLGYTHAKAGNHAEAMRLLRSLKEQARKEYITPMYMAIIYAGLGDTDQAFTWLDKAVEERAGILIFFRKEPVFQELRSDPRFELLLKRIGLEPLR